MPTVTGGWVPSGSASARMRLIITYDVPTPAVGASSVTVTGSVAVEAGNSFNDSSNTFTLGGSLGPSYNGSKSIDVGSGSRQTIHTFSQSVALTSGAQSKTLAASLTGINYVGASAKASASATVSIPARAVATPNAPSWISVVRTSDSRHTVSWAATATSDRPIDSFEVQRYRADTNAWVGFSPVGGSARSLVDTATLLDNRLQWRVRARNAAGVSGWVTSGNFHTTPSAPSGVAVARTGADAILSWTNRARYAQKLGVRSQYSTDGGLTWSAMANHTGHTDLSPTTTTRTITGLDQTRQWRFDVVAAVTQPANLFGISAPSNILQLLTPPSAPTLLAPVSIQSDQSPTVFRWRHNAVDTSIQTSFELRYRVDGGGWVTVTGASTAADSTSVQLGVSQVEWQVRTKGAHASFGPWSSIATFLVATPPAATILSPVDGAEIATNRLSLAWDFDDPQGASQTSWRAELVDGTGQIIETRTGTTVLSVAFRTELSDQSTYTYRLWVTSGTGLVSSEPAEGTVTTAFTPPAVPILSATWLDESGLVQLVVDNIDRNTIGNPSFEVSLDQWWAASSATQSRSDLWASDGSYSLRIEPTGSGSDVYSYSALRDLVTEGQTYTLRATSWLPAAPSGSNQGATQRANLVIDITGGGGGTRILAYSTPEPGVGSHEHALTFTVPSVPGSPVTALNARLYLGYTGGAIHWDDVRLTDQAVADTVTNRLERLADDGETWIVLIDDLGVTGGYSDTMVPLGRPATYRAVAISALGVEAVSDPVTIDIDSGAVWLSTEDGDMAAIRYNLSLGHKRGHTVVLEEYLDQRVPTAHFGLGRPQSATVQGSLVEGIDLEQDLGVFLGRVIYYRDPTGAAFWAVLTEGLSSSRVGPYAAQVSITATEVAHG